MNGLAAHPAKQAEKVDWGLEKLPLLAGVAALLHHSQGLKNSAAPLFLRRRVRATCIRQGTTTGKQEAREEGKDWPQPAGREQPWTGKG